MSSAPPDDEPGGLVQRTTAALNERLRRYEGRPLVEVALRIYQRDREISATVMGSAIAFRLFLFFVPLLLFVVGVAGLLSDVVDADDVNEEAALTGSLAVPDLVGAPVGLIAGVGLIALIINRIRAELGLAVAFVSFTAAFILYVVAWLVGWFFILGRAIVLGIVCNAVIFERFGGITNFVFSWPLIACCAGSA